MIDDDGLFWKWYSESGELVGYICSRSRYINVVVYVIICFVYNFIFVNIVYIIICIFFVIFIVVIVYVISDFFIMWWCFIRS